MTVDALQTILLTCADLQASLDFYVEALGLPLVQADRQMAVLRAGLVQIVLDLAAPDDHAARRAQPANGMPNGSSVTFIFKLSSPGNVLSRLRRHGVDVTETTSERTGRVLGVRDPDGRRLYLVERPV